MKDKYYKVSLQRMKENFSFPLNKELKEDSLRKASFECFGYIIVKESVLGYYEIITKTKIPALKRLKYNERECVFPNSGYRIDLRIKANVSKEEIKSYIEKNNNEEFINQIKDFIDVGNERYKKASEVFDQPKVLKKKNK